MSSRAFGEWALELMGNVWLFGDNNNFFGGNRLEQDPLYVVKAHVVYSYRPGLWFGTSLGYGKGGRTIVNGSPRDTKQKNIRFAATFAYPFNRQHGIGVTVGKAENSGAGAEFDAFAIRYQYAWGDL